ncbi:MAG: hypothetical protein U0105_02455 [Candidatus Obscuribacterales bacterium]
MMRNLSGGRRFASKLACVALLLACALRISCGAVSAAPELKFKWPVPSRVTVTETALKKGQTVKLRYDIVLEKQKDGDDMELKFDKFEFLELNGLDMTAPEAKALMGPTISQLTAIQSALPGLIINSQGRAIDVTGVEQLSDKALNMLPSADEKMRASIEAVLKSPEGIAQIKQKTKDFWRVWVQSWIGVALAPGKEKTVDTLVPFMNGNVLTVPMVIRNDGKVADAPGNIQLTGVTTLQGPEATKALGEMLLKLRSHMPVNPEVKPFTPDMVQELKRTTTFSVVTNPETLQPKTAQSEIVTDVTISDAHKSDTEKHQYAFDWSSKSEAADTKSDAADTKSDR